MDDYIIKLESKGIAKNDKELMQCKKRLEKTKQQSAYIPQLDIPEDEIQQLQSILDIAISDEAESNNCLED